MSAKSLTMLAVGDIGPRLPNADWYFTPTAPVLKSADVVVGNLENPIVSNMEKSFLPMGSQPSDPSVMSALVSSGFSLVTLAANHLWDWGVSGIEATITGLRNAGIPFIGAGMNIDEARRPAIIERNGTRFGFLNYNCAGPIVSWANPEKPGCAYINVITHHEEREGGQFAFLPAKYTFAEPSTMKAMAEDISKLRPLCDVLTVYFHKGLVNVPVTIEMYDQQVAYAAIDAGADLILSSHAHVLKGIELYKGKVIFHGLCNFVVPTRSLSEDTPTWHMKQYAKRRKERHQFEPDPEYTTYPWHPEAKHTIIAKCIVVGGKISRVSYLPCLVNKQSQPEILKHDARGQQVFDYMDKITKAAGLNARYEWDRDEVLIKT